MSWLDAQIFGYRTIQIGGVAVPSQTTLNFVTGASAVDNPAQARTDVTIAVSQISPDASGKITITGNDFDYVGNAKGTVRTRNRNVQTVDATVTDLFTWTIQPGQTIVDALVTAIKSDASQGANYKLKRRFRYGALGPIPGSLVNLETDEDDPAWDCTIDNNGTTGRVRVTGKAATTIQWFGVIQIVEVVP
jgi:hypothetical protein